MSVDFNVAVHGSNWPSSAALQTCIGKLGYPVALVRASSKPFLPSDAGLPVRYKGRRIVLDASAVRLSPTSFHAYWPDRPADHASNGVESWIIRPSDKLKGVDVNDDLNKIGAGDVHFGNGDYVLTFSFDSSTNEMRAGFFIMSAMIKCFDGYGFEMEGRTHGGSSYADELAADAQNDAVWTAMGTQQ